MMVMNMMMSGYSDHIYDEDDVDGECNDDDHHDDYAGDDKKRRGAHDGR